MREIFFIILFFLSSGILFSQNLQNQFVKVDSIIISGNKTTEDEIILRELNFKPGDFVSDDILNYNRERIYSLALFNQVEINRESSGKKNIIKIDVEESWYFWPIPFITRREHSFKKITYGVNFQYKNFRGRNEVIELITAFGYDPGFRINYFNPALDYKNGYFFQFGTGYNKFSNRNPEAKKIAEENFDYKNFSSFVAFGKRFDQYKNLGFVLGYDFIKAPFNGKDKITASENSTDHIFKTGIVYNFDTRNLKQFPDSGIYFNSVFYQKGFGFDGINYSVAMLDLRNYFKVVSKLTMKWRLALRFTIGNDEKIPYYDHSHFGGDERIRGHYNELIEGRNIYLASLEFKYPLIREWKINIKLPLIPQNLTSYRLAFFLNSFADAGTVQSAGEKFLQNKIYSGYGAGITMLILPYNIVRVEYAFNEFKKGELIFDLGFSF